MFLRHYAIQYDVETGVQEELREVFLLQETLFLQFLQGAHDLRIVQYLLCTATNSGRLSCQLSLVCLGHMLIGQYAKLCKGMHCSIVMEELSKILVLEDTISTAREEIITEGLTLEEPHYGRIVSNLTKSAGSLIRLADQAG